MPRTLFAAIALALFLVPSVKAEPLLCCGWDKVFLVEASAAERGKIEKLWTWDARQCKELSEGVRTAFGTTDECKPVDGGAKILISSSSGGCALVERPSGRTVWCALVPNAHSLELLPRSRIVVASSVDDKGNRLVLFDLARSNRPIWETALVSAHGVVWDEGRRALWALGLKELRCYELKDWESDKPSLVMKASHDLPDGDGHDLQPLPKSNDLIVTTGPHVYLFDRDKHTFRLHPELGGRANVKSVSVHPITSQTVFVQATESWWSDTLGLLAPAGKTVLPKERLYKARWLTQATTTATCGIDEKPSFRFAQVNDLHVQATEPAVQSAQQQTYKQANEKARWAVEAINGAVLPPCDFVVGGGDLINGEGLKRLEPDLRALRAILKPLRCPFYPVVGNHEVVQQERSPQYLQPFRDAFGRDRTDYTFTHGGILFVALNNSGAPSAEAAKQRNQWLRDVLSEGRGQPKIILCHIPLIPLRDEATLAKSFGFTSYRDHDPGTLKLIEEHHDTVIAVLSGHLHLTGMKRHQGIFHISIAGTASYPCDIANYDVYPDRIEVVVKQLPERLAKAEASIHGKERHGRDFTDGEHRTPEEYQIGRADERRFTISLSGNKRPQMKQ
jgi:predicted MPP superfamily phosphohydrolase